MTKQSEAAKTYYIGHDPGMEQRRHPTMGRLDEGYAQKGIQINEWKSHPVRCSRITGSEFWGNSGNVVL